VKVITLEIHEDLVAVLEVYLINELRELFKVTSPPPVDVGLTDRELWLSTPEGKLHSMLFTNYVLRPSTMRAKVAMAIQRRLQYQGKETRGRPRVYKQGLHNWVTQRQVRIFLLNKLIAKSLGIDSTNWELPSQLIDAQEEYVTMAPIDAYDSLTRFEKWSGVALPEEAWVLVTKQDRIRAAKKYPDLPTGSDGDVLFNVYVKHRAKNIEFKDELSSKAYFDAAIG